MKLICQITMRNYASAITRKPFQCFHHSGCDKKKHQMCQTKVQQLVFFKQSRDASLEEGQFNIMGRVIIVTHIQSS